MTKEDVIKKIDKLTEEIESLKKEIGKFNPYNLHNDKLFLLSETEYNLVKENIEKYCSFFGNIWWLLRSPNYGNRHYARVIGNDSTACISYIDDTNGVVVAFFEETYEEPGTIQIKYKFPFVYVGNNFWISEAPIFFGRFDEESNDYEKSEIRQRILKWAEERSNDEKQ